MNAKTEYEFVNAQTGDVIAYLSLASALEKDAHTLKLEKKKVSLATADLKPNILNCDINLV